METKRARWFAIAALFALIAIGFHFYLANQHYALKYGSSTGPSVCNISDKLNCDAVASSSYSAVFGIPIAVFGVTANLILALLLVIAWLGWTDDREGTGRWGLWLSGLVAVASLVMGGISLIFMSVYCLFCIITYVLSFLTLFAAWKGQEEPAMPHLAGDIASLASNQKWILIMLALIPGLAYMGHLSASKGHREAGGGMEIEVFIQEKIAQWKTAPTQVLDETKGLIKGPADAKMTIVEFADFRCSHCKNTAPTMHAFTAAHPDVKFIFKFFPLDGSCNAGMNGGDGISCRIAEVVQCEEKLNKRGWAAHDYFFAEQDRMLTLSKPDQVNETYCGANSAVDCKALGDCVASAETKAEVKAMAQEGQTAQISGTPTIFVNKRFLNRGNMQPVLEGTYKAIQTP